MKIIFSSYDSIKNPFYGGGGAIVIHEIAKRLVSDTDVLVLTSAYKGARSEVIDGVKYETVGLTLNSPLLTQVIFQFMLPFYMLKYSSQYDVWIENFTSPFATSCLQLFTRKPVVGLVQLLAGKELSLKYFNLPFAFFEQTKLKSYRYLIAINEQMKQKVRSVSSQSKIVVIHNGIDESLRSFQGTRKHEHILYMGRIDIWQKGLDILLDSFKKIEHKTKLNLVICGGGDSKDVKEMMDRIRDLGLEKRVKYLGKVSGSKKKAAFLGAVCLAAPSRYETQPLVILEAFALGIPVICFDITDLSWIKDKYCIKINPFSVTQYAKALSEIGSNSDKRTTIAKNALQYSKQFDWDTAAIAYKKFFRQSMEQYV